jgi:hypothetical protein
METFYFLGAALGGGFMALFASAGWSSFKHKKIPEKGILFRWFVAGLCAAGFLAYAWIFGSGGDMGEVLQKIGGALDLENVMKLSGVVGAVSALSGSGADGTGAIASEADANESKKNDITVGMPRF